MTELMNELITLYKRPKVANLQTTDIELWNDIKHIIENKEFIDYLKDNHEFETIDNDFAKTIKNVYNVYNDNYMFTRMVAFSLYH